MIGEIEAAVIVGSMVGKCDHTVQEWRSTFFENNGMIPEGKQGNYPRTGVLWKCVDLNIKESREFYY